MYAIFRLFVRKLVQVFYRALYRVRVIGLERLPRSGPTIIAANHISMHDPVILSAFLNHPICFMAKEELFRVPFVSWLIKRCGAFPVSRNRVGIAAIRHSMRLLSAGRVVGIFPEGTRNPRGLPLEAKPGVGFIATKVPDVCIVPMAITVRPYHFFRPHYLILGKPISVAHLLQNGDYRYLATLVMEKIRELQHLAEHQEPSLVMHQKTFE